jgi:hypothetical protein
MPGPDLFFSCCRHSRHQNTVMPGTAVLALQDTQPGPTCILRSSYGTARACTLATSNAPRRRAATLLTGSNSPTPKQGQNQVVQFRDCLTIGLMDDEESKTLV